MFENIAKDEILQGVESFVEDVKSSIKSRKSAAPATKLWKFMKPAIEILNAMDDVEVASRFG